MNRTKKICNLGLGIALYVVMSAAMKIPLIGHIQTDLGYVVFGAYCVILGWPATIIGGIGCMIESLIFSGWFPVGWMFGQACIGIMCGLWYKRSQDYSNIFRYVTRIMVTVIAVFVGIGLIKTIVECLLYSIPFEVKFAKDLIAFIADTIPMIIGMFLGDWLLKLRPNIGK